MLFQIMMTDGLTQAVATVVGSRGTEAEETDRTVVTVEGGVVDTATGGIRTEVHSDHNNTLPPDSFCSILTFPCVNLVLLDFI